MLCVIYVLLKLIFLHSWRSTWRSAES